MQAGGAGLLPIVKPHRRRLGPYRATASHHLRSRCNRRSTATRGVKPGCWRVVDESWRTKASARLHASFDCGLVLTHACVSLDHVHVRSQLACSVPHAVNIPAHAASSTGTCCASAQTKLYGVHPSCAACRHLHAAYVTTIPSDVIAVVWIGRGAQRERGSGPGGLLHVPLRQRRPMTSYSHCVWKRTGPTSRDLTASW